MRENSDQRFSNSEYDFLLSLKERTMGICKKCTNGWIEDEPCECRNVFIYLKELVYARIPQEYWTLEWDNISVSPRSVKILVKKYIDNFKTAKMKGKGICFLGTNGIGKTTLMIEIAKRAILNGESIIYLTAQDYINYKMISDTDTLYRIESGTEVILLDELDKPYKKKGSDYVPAQIENLFRNVLPRNVIVCIGANWKEEEIQEYFGDSIFSIISRKVKFLHLTGEDKSKELQDKWEDDLEESSTNYLSDYFKLISSEIRRKQNDRHVSRHNI